MPQRPRQFDTPVAGLSPLTSPDATQLLEIELSAKGTPANRSTSAPTPSLPGYGTHRTHYPRRAGGAGAVQSTVQHLITKSALIGRDADILGRMGQAGLARAFFRSLPWTARHHAGAQLEAAQTLADFGATVGVLVAPVILGLNEHELGVVLERAKATGAVSTGYVVLTLPLEIKELFHQRLEAARPDRA